MLPQAAALEDKAARKRGRKRGNMSEAWAQWEGHVINGEFHLQKYLGGSSQSAVFLTEHRAGALRPAAIKLIRANDATRNLYLSRWSAAEKLSHPHLIQPLQKGCCRLGNADLLFMVMEYAEENLAEIIPERPLTPDEVRQLLPPALEALAYLHSQSFVHARLKPSNILAAKDQLKLSSDGVLVIGEAVPAVDKPNAYDAPERAGGKISPAADVWSLGMTVAEALTQHRPAWDVKDQTDPEVGADLRAPFADIVRGCLRRDPQQRLTIKEISLCLDGKPSSAQPPPLVVREKASAQPEPTLQPRPEAKPQPRPVPALQSGQPKPGSPNSLVAPVLMTVLAITAVLVGVGLLRRQPDAGDVKPSQQNKQSSPNSRGYQQPPGSRDKPSPAASGRRAATGNTDSAIPAPALKSVAAGSEVVVYKVLPDVPQKARDTIHGTIRVGVKVQVDPFGNVVGTEMDSPGPSKYFARLAAEAAQSWKFAPSNRDADRDFLLRFDFTNTETTVSATQAP
jgi:serine/threonine protein kinase